MKMKMKDITGIYAMQTTKVSHTDVERYNDTMDGGAWYLSSRLGFLWRSSIPPW